MTSELLTTKETAALLRVQPSTVRAWMRPSRGRQQRLPYVKLGRCVRIRRSDAEALIKSSVVLAQTGNGDPSKAQLVVSSDVRSDENPGNVLTPDDPVAQPDQENRGPQLCPKGVPVMDRSSDA